MPIKNVRFRATTPRRLDDALVERLPEAKAACTSEQSVSKASLRAKYSTVASGEAAEISETGLGMILSFPGAGLGLGCGRSLPMIVMSEIGRYDG